MKILFFAIMIALAGFSSVIPPSCHGSEPDPENIVADKDEQKKRTTDPRLSEEDKKIIEMMEMLQLMEALDDPAFFQDLNILVEE